MFASLKSIAPSNGKGVPAAAGSLFPFMTDGETSAVESLLSNFPSVPAKILLALAVVDILSRTVTPQRVCACGCGAFVTGKAKTSGAACRQRLSRSLRAARPAGGRQFNLVLQDELPAPSVTPKTFAEKMVKLSHDLQACITEAGMIRGAGIRAVKCLAKENNLLDWPDTKTTDDYLALIYQFRREYKLPPHLYCDNCCEVTYPNWWRCIHCAHYFCRNCHPIHGCGTVFKCAEQLEREKSCAEKPLTCAI